MKTVFGVVALFVFIPPASAQDAAVVQKLFEAGRYQQVVENASESASPAVLYLVGQSHQKLGEINEAISVFRWLVDLEHDDAWRLIGLSAQLLLQHHANTAVVVALQAVEEAPDLPEASYQLGLSLAAIEHWAQAATAFEHAVELSPSSAYARYYSGLMDFRSGRADRVAVHFEYFLRLAPDAPEATEVRQILRTIRYR